MAGSVRLLLLGRCCCSDWLFGPPPVFRSFCCWCCCCCCRSLGLLWHLLLTTPPVSWLTLRGLLMSCGLVPTGWWCLVGTTTANGMRTDIGGHSYSDTCGVSGVAGDRLACVNIPGLVRLDRALRPPGLDAESASSLSEWPRLPVDWLSSDWLPESPPLSMYRMQRFLRLENRVWATINT